MAAASCPTLWPLRLQPVVPFSVLLTVAISKSETLTSAAFS